MKSDIKLQSIIDLMNYYLYFNNDNRDDCDNNNASTEICIDQSVFKIKNGINGRYKSLLCYYEVNDGEDYHLVFKLGFNHIWEHDSIIDYRFDEYCNYDRECVPNFIDISELDKFIPQYHHYNEKLFKDTIKNALEKLYNYIYPIYSNQ